MQAVDYTANEQLSDCPNMTCSNMLDIVSLPQMLRVCLKFWHITPRSFEAMIVTHNLLEEMQGE